MTEDAGMTTGGEKGRGKGGWILALGLKPVTE
jgi:hypothetical protein